jgi:hypothetical protein
MNDDETFWMYATRVWRELFRPTPVLIILLCVAWYTGASTGEIGGYIAATVSVAAIATWLNEKFSNCVWWLLMPPGWYRRKFAVDSSDTAFEGFPGVVAEDERSSRIFFVVPAEETNMDRRQVPELVEAVEWMVENLPEIVPIEPESLLRSFAWQHKYDEFILVRQCPRDDAGGEQKNEEQVTK